MSGLIPGLEHYLVGNGSQREGHSYLGLGVLLLLVVSFPEWLTWTCQRFTRHLVLFCVTSCFVAFALSNKVHLGSHLLLQVPLPDCIVYALGTLRSSGRFIRLIGYALIAGSTILTMPRYRPASSIRILAVATMVQLVDVNPLRKMVYESSDQPAAPIFDRPAEPGSGGKITDCHEFPELWLYTFIVGARAWADTEG